MASAILSPKVHGVSPSRPTKSSTTAVAILPTPHTPYHSTPPPSPLPASSGVHHSHNDSAGTRVGVVVVGVLLLRQLLLFDFMNFAAYNKKKSIKCTHIRTHTRSQISAAVTVHAPVCVCACASQMTLADAVACTFFYRIS